MLLRDIYTTQYMQFVIMYYATYMYDINIGVFILKIIKSLELCTKNFMVNL